MRKYAILFGVFLTVSGQAPQTTPTISALAYRSNQIAFDELQVYVRRGQTPDLLPGDFERAYATVASQHTYSGELYGVLFRFAYYRAWQRVDDPEFDSTMILNLTTHSLYYLNNRSREFVKFGPRAWTTFAGSERALDHLAGLFAPKIRNRHRTVQLHVPPKVIDGFMASGWKVSETETGTWRLLPKYPAQKVRVTRTELLYFSNEFHEPCPRFWYSVGREGSNEPVDFCEPNNAVPFVFYDREQESGTTGLARRFVTVTARGHLRSLGPQDKGLFRVPPGYRNACINAAKSNNFATMFCS